MISHGHKLSEIRYYTKNQVVLFLKAINEIEKQRLKGDTISTRIAQAEQKDFKAFLKDLDKE